MRVVMLAFTNIEYTIELSEALAKFVDLTLMLPDHNYRPFEGKISNDINLMPFVQPKLRKTKNVVFVYNLVKKMKKLNPDVIHMQRGHPWLNLGLPFLREATLVNTVHDVNLHVGDKESSKVPLFTHNLAIGFSKKIIVHSNKLKLEFIQKYRKPESDIYVIPRGINSIYLRYVDNCVKEDKNTILFFGRIWPYKGLQYLIKAEPYITEVIPDANIIIAGRGENVLKNYLPLMNNPHKFKIFNKHISNDMVAELFLKSSVVALPYIEASQSGVIPLAYAFKKPVVVTDVGSLSEVVDNGKTGFVVTPKNHRQLAEKIIFLLKNSKKRKEMGENAYTKAINELSWDKIAEKTIEVYKRSII
jgi:glycosyltransferase involved in cell wall biosynthesis